MRRLAMLGLLAVTVANAEPGERLVGSWHLSKGRGWDVIELRADGTGRVAAYGRALGDGDARDVAAWRVEGGSLTLQFEPREAPPCPPNTMCGADPASETLGFKLEGGVLLLQLAGLGGTTGRYRRMTAKQEVEQDERILERAGEILARDADWNRHDDRGCPKDATSYSLFCALQKASIEVLGGYDHRRAALEAVRAEIEERGKAYEHRLMGFNNDPTTTLADVKQVLRQARRRLARPASR